MDRARVRGSGPARAGRGAPVAARAWRGDHRRARRGHEPGRLQDVRARRLCGPRRAAGAPRLRGRGCRHRARDGTELASGGGAVGDEVLAFRISGGYSSAITLPAKDVFAKPATLGFPEAANLLLAGSTAAEALDVTRVAAGDTVLIHGGSGAVGVSAIQQAKLLGARVIATTSPAHADEVRGFGAEPVGYGDGLEQRVRSLAPAGIDVAIDTVGTAEAVEVSLALVAGPRADPHLRRGTAGQEHGFAAIGGRMPASAVFRDAVRPSSSRSRGRARSSCRSRGPSPSSTPSRPSRSSARVTPGGKLALIP
ncbi:MAG: zinc-binding dehydrogenase [Galbitalea sp.]